MGHVHSTQLSENMEQRPVEMKTKTTVWLVLDDGGRNGGHRRDIKLVISRDDDESKDGDVGIRFQMAMVMICFG
ncbi:hypothetical protein Tco_1397455 [Tanacetum coccineum]